jgi:hypothetical protein
MGSRQTVHQCVLQKAQAFFPEFDSYACRTHASWNADHHDENVVKRWAAAALAVGDTEEVGWSVVDTLLQIASSEFLRPHISTKLWARMKTQRSLPRYCLGRSCGTVPRVVSFFRGRGDVDILKSYLLLVWSEWNRPSDVNGMEDSIRQAFGGIEMHHHRKDLIKRLDDVLRELDQGLEHFRQHTSWLDEEVRRRKMVYEQLRKVLQKIDEEGRNIPTCMSPNLIHSKVPILIVCTGCHLNFVVLCPPHTLVPCCLPVADTFCIFLVAGGFVFSSSDKLLFQSLFAVCHMDSCNLHNM